MKILYVITKANWGGAQRYVYDLATAAKATGHEVAVAFGEPGELERRLNQSGIRSIGIPSLGNAIGGRDLGALKELRQTFRTERPDVVHINSSKAGALGCLAARLEQVPCILFTAHGWAFNESRPLWQRLIIKVIAWFTMILAHKTIAVSEAIKRDVAHWPFIAQRITVIRNGIDCAALLPREEARAVLAPHNTTHYWIGMVSELHPTKCVADAIEAFALIAAKHPDASLVVMGEGRERKRLEKLIEQHALGKQVVLAGFKEQAPSLLSAFDLFVHASKSEALGYVILEAGCAGLPVVATKVGGIPEIITDESLGTLVPPRDPVALAEATATFWDDPERTRQAGQALRERVRTAFSKAASLKATFALYEKR